ncbi:extracellular solute-binding protein [Paenibacillus endoradicis]|uniref:extracellular solute-binding protein n=1 Tax=Paenibacillus endoradicis TaxID=2972487 RepID=UPI0021590F73|nr:extracellular solute-binding protein [Paenibacillus endoradicis]MCR8655814.1 extracellular solute-binding protein [Paenibacillus endoradicis]MCR8658140.1 extracellular solute-binding protein [Paenibacillus endoradicis]
MKTIKRIWLLLACSLFITSCTNTPNNEASNVIEDIYTDPIILRVPYSYSDIELPEGDIGEENFMSRYILEKTGIIIQYSWDAGGEEQYNAKIDLSIRSNDLPDMFIVNRKQLYYLVQNDMIADLTEVYEKHSSELVKSIYDATDGKALEEATMDQKLYALPNVGIEADAPTYLWVRQDWLDKLNLPEPRTLADIEKISYAFIHEDPDENGKDDTLGIPVEKSLVYQDKTGVFGLNSFFSAYHSFPQNWIVNSEGILVYGSIQEETKQALIRLAEWYDKGIIDRDFMIRKDASIPVTENHMGIMFAPWWAPIWPLNGSVSQDTKAEWNVFAVPLSEQGEFITKISPITDRYLVIRKNYSNPEVAVKLLNLTTKLERHVGVDDESSEAIRVTAQQLGIQLRNYFPFDLLLDDPDGVTKRYDTLVQAMNGDIDVSTLNSELAKLYDYVVKETEQPKKDMEAWSNTQAYLLGGKISKEPMVMVESYNIEHTEAYEEYWDTLITLEMDYFLKIITGELPIDAFDQFVEEWLSSGGVHVLKEATQAYESQK